MNMEIYNEHLTAALIHLALIITARGDFFHLLMNKYNYKSKIYRNQSICVMIARFL